MMNPSEKHCFSFCKSCWRCENKGMKAECSRCSGRHDPELRRDPYDIDDMCRCKEGILQFRLQDGRMVKRRFNSNPFAGKVITDAETEDERDWNSFLAEKREKLNNEHWDPIQFTDGSSTDSWLRKNRGI